MNLENMHTVEYYLNRAHELFELSNSVMDTDLSRARMYFSAGSRLMKYLDQYAKQGSIL